MKKSTTRIFALVIIATFLFALSINFVSAQATNELVLKVQEIGKGIFEIVKPILEAIIGEVADGEYFLAKVVLLIMLFGILWTALGRMDFFSDNIMIQVIVSIGVTILAVRLLVNDWIVSTILLPYSALGIAITAGLPFVLFFLIVRDWTPTARKIAWTFFAVVFIALWFTRDDLGAFGYIYIVTAGLALAMLLFDKTIQRAWKRSQSEATRSLAESRIRSKLTKQRAELEDQKADGTITKTDYDRQNTHLEKLEKKYALK
jgi:hypothetical protein